MGEIVLFGIFFCFAILTVGLVIERLKASDHLRALQLKKMDIHCNDFLNLQDQLVKEHEKLHDIGLKVGEMEKKMNSLVIRAGFKQ